MKRLLFYIKYIILVLLYKQIGLFFDNSYTTHIVFDIIKHYTCMRVKKNLCKHGGKK